MVSLKVLTAAAGTHQSSASSWIRPLRSGYGYGDGPTTAMLPYEAGLYMGYGMGYGRGGWYGKREAGFGPRGDSDEGVSSFAKLNNFGAGSPPQGSDSETGSAKFARQVAPGFDPRAGTHSPLPQPFDSGHN